MTDLLHIDEEVQRAQEAERAFRELAQSIALAPDVRELMADLARVARTIARADGAFVEGIVPNELVEILATTGQGTPPKGQRVAYPGSLTEEIIEKRKPHFFVKMEGIGVATAPYLKRTCDGCSALVVPIFGGRGPLGALVILRRPNHPEFEPDVVDRIVMVADLASIAMQRIATLEESERGREAAEAAVRSRDDVLAIVSHDLRNPLHTVVSAASLLGDDATELSADQRRQQVEIISRSAWRMDRLIQDLLDVTRLEAGRPGLRRKCEDPAAIASEACDTVESQAREKSLRFTFSVAGELRPSFVDRGRLLQALWNYLSNAVKFTPEEGHVELVVAPTSDGGVRFSVTDTGPGIPPEQLPHIFDRFWQGRSAPRAGAGLGLAIASGIAKAHDGRAWAESKVGVGSTFYLEIPPTKDCG